MYYGAGALMFASRDQGVLHVGRLSQFTLARESEQVEAFGFPLSPGPAQKIDSASQQETWTFTIQQASQDYLDTQFFLDQIAGTAASIELPGSTYSVVVPTTAPYEVAIAGMVADQFAVCTVVSTTAPLYLKQVTGATAVAAGKFKTATGKITFDIAQAGKTIAVFYLETKSNFEVIGGNLPQASYGELYFRGIELSTRTKQHIVLPRLKYDRNYSQQIGGGVQETAAAYEVLAPADWPQPFALYPFTA